ncbi:hypothetical protein TASCI_40130 [Tenacibaculum ascidiaceicola]
MPTKEAVVFTAGIEIICLLLLNITPNVLIYFNKQVNMFLFCKNPF